MRFFLSKNKRFIQAPLLNKSKGGAGFSLVEVMVAILIGVLVIEAAYLFFPIGKRIAREGEALNEIAQDARIVLNRLKRELRQTPIIITNIPEERNNGIELVEFEDGFPGDEDPDPHYIRYQRNINLIERVTYHFTDPDNPGTVVDYAFPNAVETIENTETIAENIHTVRIYTDGDLVKIYLRLEERGKNITLLTGVYPRNSQI